MVAPAIGIGIVAGLIANGLTSLTAYGIPKAKNLIKYKGDIRQALEADGTLVSSIRGALVDITGSAKVQSFLESPTAESIVRQIYSDLMLNGERQKSLAQIQEEFKICFANYLGKNVQAVAPSAVALFDIIVTGCQKSLDLAINEGILSAHEAKSIARHRVVLDELHAIEHNLTFLTARSYSDSKTIEDFEKQYRHQVGIRQSRITIPHFDRAPTVDIDDIFVSPNFICPLREKRQEQEVISLDDFLTRLYRSVLLGDPGGGKSTLAQKICYDLDKNYEKRLVAGRLLTPVLVILRDYSARKKKDDSSII